MYLLNLLFKFEIRLDGSVVEIIDGLLKIGLVWR